MYSSKLVLCEGGRHTLEVSQLVSQEGSGELNTALESFTECFKCAVENVASVFDSQYVLSCTLDLNIFYNKVLQEVQMVNSVFKLYHDGEYDRCNQALARIKTLENNNQLL